MTSYTLVLRDACGAKFREVVPLDQLKRENPADAIDIEQTLAAGRNFCIRDRRGSLTIYAH